MELLPFLACFASSLGQRAFVALSVGQQGSCGQSVLYSHRTMWGKSMLSSKLASEESVHIRTASDTSRTRTETHAAWETKWELTLQVR